MKIPADYGLQTIITEAIARATANVLLKLEHKPKKRCTGAACKRINRRKRRRG